VQFFPFADILLNKPDTRGSFLCRKRPSHWRSSRRCSTLNLSGAEPGPAVFSKDRPGPIARLWGGSGVCRLTPRDAINAARERKGDRRQAAREQTLDTHNFAQGRPVFVGKVTARIP